VRSAVTIVALLFVCGFGFMTIYVMLRSGPDLLTGVSLIVLALMAVGILGALTAPPDKRR
jgi:hypothetical protein